jgi:hypothetical protein
MTDSTQVPSPAEKALDLQHLPIPTNRSARQASVQPDLKQSLISLGQLWDHGCDYVLRIPFVRGLNDEKGPMRRVETTRRGFEAAKFDEEDFRPRKPDEEAQTDEKGPTSSLV